MNKFERLISEYYEIKAKATEEAKFVIIVSKLESDIQINRGMTADMTSR